MLFLPRAYLPARQPWRKHHAVSRIIPIDLKPRNCLTTLRSNNPPSPVELSTSLATSKKKQRKINTDSLDIKIMKYCQRCETCHHRYLN